jgi:serine/threonine protein kinase
MEKLPDWDKWQFSPFNRASRESYRTRIDPPHAQHRVTAAANIWAIGMVMYQLVTLDEPHEVDNMVKRMNENRLRSQRGRVVRSAGTMRHPDYDENLLELVLDCLRLTPEERPTPEKALQTIDGWLKNHQENVQMDRTTQDGERVFYKANEINYMSPGGFNFGITDKWWKGYFNRDEIWLDENWGKLKPPGRPEYLDPWRVEKRSRGAEDDYVGPATALQRENYRVKRRKTDTDGDVDDTEAETLIVSQTVALNRGRRGMFSNGFQIVQQPVDNSDQVALNLLQLQTRSPAQQGGFQQQQGGLSQQQSRYPYGFTRLQVGNPGGGYIRRDSATPRPKRNPLATPLLPEIGITLSPKFLKSI